MTAYELIHPPLRLTTHNKKAPQDEGLVYAFTTIIVIVPGASR